MSQIENAILDILDANPQGLDHEKLIRQVKTSIRAQPSTINIAIGALERDGKITKGMGLRYQVVRDAPGKRLVPAAERDQQVLGLFASTPLMTVNEVAEALYIDRSGADDVIKRLLARGELVDSGRALQSVNRGPAAIQYMLPTPAVAQADEPEPVDAPEDQPQPEQDPEPLPQELTRTESIYRCFTTPKSARTAANELGFSLGAVASLASQLHDKGRLKVAFSTDPTGARHYLQSHLDDPSAPAPDTIEDEQPPPPAAQAEVAEEAPAPYVVTEQPKPAAPASDFVVAPTRVSVFQKDCRSTAVNIEVEPPSGKRPAFVRIWLAGERLEEAIPLTLAELEAVTNAARDLLKQHEAAML